MAFSSFYLVVQRLRMTPASNGALLRLHYYYYYYIRTFIVGSLTFRPLLVQSLTFSVFPVASISVLAVDVFS